MPSAEPIVCDTTVNTDTSPGEADTDSTHPYAHLRPVWRTFLAADPGSSEHGTSRDQLVLGYRPVVEHIALRYTRTRPETRPDLVQVGLVGLLKAVDSVDPDRITGDVLAYLITCVTGEMRRYFRDHTWMMRTPRPLKDLAVAITRETAALTTRLGRAPRPSELAAALDTDVATVIEALGARDAQRPNSLDAERRDDAGTGGTSTLADTIGVVEPAFTGIEQQEAVRPLIKALPARERAILTLRFFGDMTQSQIGHRLGISQMHVSRLLAQTLATLRRQLADAEHTDLHRGTDHRRDAA